MASYSFSSREIAETLADVGRKAMAGAPLPQEPTGRETIFVKTPANGIAARSGDVCTAEDCTRVYLSALEFSEKSSLTVPVVNTTEEFVEGSIYISATRVGVYWVFDGEASGSSLKQLTATSAISAASGLTFGTGTADILQINSGGTAYETAGLADVDIINPWEESIASGAMLTCYKEGAKYVIVQVSCPA